MAAGRPGDHPVSDILIWDRSVYGPEPDAMFKKLAQLMSAREINEWWESHIGWEATRERASAEIAEKFDWAIARAKSGGWQVE